jgi:molybdopterin converting factor small subunit
MALTVLFFGRLRDAARTSEMLVDDVHGTVATLTEWLGARDPALGEALEAPGVRVAVDQRFARADASLRGVREVAYMAPLSGG